jgi:hypothetical protein
MNWKASKVQQGVEFGYGIFLDRVASAEEKWIQQQ